MSSSSEKGNISPFLLVLSFIAILALLISFAKMMVFQNLSSGKYRDPNVAGKIVEGNIYDVNGKTLSMQVPVYNIFFDLGRMSSAELDDACNLVALYTDLKSSDIQRRCNNSKTSFFMVEDDIDQSIVDQFKTEVETAGLSSSITVEKTFKRIYPSQFHAAQIINETEKCLAFLLSPRPGYNTSTTYGKNIYLSLDMDIQYLLDVACAELYNQQKTSYVTGCIINAETGFITACTTYPYYDLNNASDKDLTNKALLSEINGIKVKIVDKITDNDGKIYTYGENYDAEYLGYSVNLPQTVMLSQNSECSTIAPIPALEKPKYYIFITCSNPTQIVTGALANTVSKIEAGLRAQSKVN